MSESSLGSEEDAAAWWTFPWRDADRPRGDFPLDRGAGIALLIIMALAGTIVATSLWRSPDLTGREDWDYFISHYEACRKSIVDYGEFPWWNPWNSGGMPLFANPQVGVFSPTMLLALALGAEEGLKAAVALHVVAAAAGAFVFAWRLFGNVAAASAAGLIYALAGSSSSAFAVGHLSTLTYAFLPWALWSVREAARDPRYGVATGVFLALAALTALHYITLFTFVLVGLYGLVQLSRANGPRRRLFQAATVAGAVVLAMAAERVLASGQLVREYPRRKQDIFRVAYPALDAAEALWRPMQNLDDARRTPSLVGWHELACYIGAPATILFLASLAGGWRWWHTLTLATLLLAMGNTESWHPSRWLESVPIFNVMRVPTRWRQVGMLGVALGAGSCLAFVSRRRPRLAVAIALLVAADLGGNAWWMFHQAFVVPRPIVKLLRAEPIVQLLNAPVVGRAWSALAPCLRSNYGVIDGYEPLIAFGQAREGGPIGRGQEGYAGEFGPASVVRQTHWSPSRIVLEGPPGAIAWVNQNGGGYWRADGAMIDEKAPAVARNRLVRAAIGPGGTVVLTPRPRMMGWGVGAQFVAAAFAIGMVVRWGRKGRS